MDSCSSSSNASHSVRKFGRPFAALLVVCALMMSVPVAPRGASGADVVLGPSSPTLSHAPIRIDNNTTFATVAVSDGWPGNGTSGNPYLIQGLVINAPGHGSAIFIGNVTVHFLVQDCILKNASLVASPYKFAAGVTLFNTTNGTIESVTCRESQEGVVLRDCSGILVANSTCSHVSSKGIDLISSDGNVIRNNTCQYSNNGLWMESSNDNVLTDNNCTNNQRGIRMSSTCQRNNVTGNDFSWSWKTVEAYSSPYDIFAQNHCSHSTYGFQLSDCGHSRVLGNDLLDDGWAGVYIVNSPGCQVWGNVMTGCSIVLAGTKTNVMSHDIGTNNTVNGKPVCYLTALGTGSVPADAGQVILAGVSNVTTAGASISSTTYAILLLWSDHVTVSASSLTGSTDGIYTDSCSNLTIVDCIISRNQYGAYLYSTKDVRLAGNLFENNSQSAIYLSSSVRAALYSNDMRACSISLVGGRTTMVSQEIATNNTVNGLPVRYYKNMDWTGPALSAQSGQIILANVSHAWVEGQLIENVSNPLILGYCSNATVEDSDFRSASTAVLAEGTVDSLFRNVSASNCGTGLHLEQSDHNRVTDCSFLDCEASISLGNSDRNEIDGISAVSNEYGVYLTSSNENMVHDCLLERNLEYGVSLYGSTHNIVWNNTFTENNGAFDGYSDYHVQAYDSDNNTWNTTHFGNFWSDWTRPDANHDGIVDQPYLIDGFIARDLLPRVPPDFTPPEITIYSPQNGTVLNSLSFTASWSVVDTGSGVNRIQVRLDSGLWVDVGLAAAVNLTAPAPSAHTLAVRAYDNASNVAVATTNFSIVLGGMTPSAPLGLEAHSGDGYVSLAWQPPASQGGSAVQYYQIYRGEGAATPTVFRSTTSLAFNDTNVTNGLTYLYTVRAVNTAGAGLHSNQATGMPMAEPPTAPQELVALGGNGTVYLSWEAPASAGAHPVLGYRVYRSGGGAGLAFLANVSGTSYQDHAVTNGVTYTYEVGAYSLSGDGEAASAVNVTPIYSTVPAKVTGVQALVQGARIVLTWDQPSDGGMSISGYKVYGCLAGATPVLLAQTTARQCNITSFENDTTYSYLVTAVNLNGEGPRSDVLLVTPNVPAVSHPPDVVFIGIVIAVVAVGIVAGAWFIKSRRSGRPKQ